MEDWSLIPSSCSMRTNIRTLAQKFLDYRPAIQERYDEYRARWHTAIAIEKAPEAFIDESRLMLGILWNRMKMEDDVLHPKIVRDGCNNTN